MIESAARVPSLAENAVEVVRDALGRIEEAAQQDDDAKWLDLSRRFALVVSPLRDYLNAVQMGRDQPHYLARKLEPLLDSIDEAQDLTHEIGLDDHVAALRMLAREAQASSSR